MRAAESSINAVNLALSPGPVASELPALFNCEPSQRPDR